MYWTLAGSWGWGCGEVERMNYGFDLEGTLDAAPEVFRPLCRALMQAGHGVYVITGLFPGATREQRLQQLFAIGFFHRVQYTSLLCVPGTSPEEIGTGKANACKEYRIGLYVDDRADFLAEMQGTNRAWFKGAGRA